MKDLLRSPSDYFPMIRRGQSANLEEKEVVSTGWNMEVTSRKEREEALRYVLIFEFPILSSIIIIQSYNRNVHDLLGRKRTNLN